jgi:hypothetical protein
MSDWDDACDPVPAKQGDEQRRFKYSGASEDWMRGDGHRGRMSAAMKRKSRPNRLNVDRQQWILDEDFDEMGV